MSHTNNSKNVKWWRYGLGAMNVTGESALCEIQLDVAVLLQNKECDHFSLL